MWSFDNAVWPVYIAALVFCGPIGVIVGAFAGVNLFSSLTTMMVFGGIFEGISQGWTHYGWGGAICGALVGIVAACVIVMLPMMLIHFVMIVCGIDPFASLDSPEEKKSEST